MAQLYNAGMEYKQPESVLVLIHTPDMHVLLLERCDFADGWQSVTGSLEAGEAPLAAAWRELHEETGFGPQHGELHDWHFSSQYEIYPRWRHRYAPGVTHNTEHVFSFCLPQTQDAQLACREHRQARWLAWQDAAERVFSPSNAQAILRLARERS